MRAARVNWAAALAVAGGGAVVVLLAFAGQGPREALPTGAVPDAMPESRCRMTRATPAVRAEGIAVICDNVYAETGLDGDHIDELRKDVDLGSRNVERFFGTLRSGPLVFFCYSPACKIALGASPAAASSDDFGFASADVTLADGAPVSSAVVVSGPFESSARVLTHELVHAEMKSWLPYDSLPTWFNEGTATFIANEPPCTAAAAARVDVTTLATKAAWQRYLDDTGRVHETYCAARAKVATWMQRFESDAMRTEGLRTLMTAVKRGTPFESAFDAY